MVRFTGESSRSRRGAGEQGGLQPEGSAFCRQAPSEMEKERERTRRCTNLAKRASRGVGEVSLL